MKDGGREEGEKSYKGFFLSLSISFDRSLIALTVIYLLSECLLCICNACSTNSFFLKACGCCAFGNGKNTFLQTLQDVFEYFCSFIEFLTSPNDTLLLSQHFLFSLNGVTVQTYPVDFSSDFA